MKFTAKDFEQLQKDVADIVQLVTPEALDSLKVNPRVRDFNMRVRWDIFWATKFAKEYNSWDFRYKDAEIDTALRRIFKLPEYQHLKRD